VCMDIKDEMTLYDEFCKLYANSVSSGKEPFTFSVIIAPKKGKKHVFHNGATYTNVGIVSISSFSTKIVGFEFEPNEFSKVSLRIHNRDRDIKKFIDKAKTMDPTWKLTDQNVKDFLDSIETEFKNWEYQTKKIDSKLIEELHKEYDSFFSYIKEYDKQKSTRFYELVRLGMNNF